MSADPRSGFGYRYETSYGKARVPVYRMGAAPLRGLTPIPESAFVGRANTLVALEVDVEVLEGDVLASYTEGDNRNVVATDSMKNLVLREALAHDGPTVEGFLLRLGRTLLDRYGHLGRLRLGAEERPFAAVPVPDGEGFGPSGILFALGDGDRAVASLEVARGADGPAVADHRCGRVGLRLLKVTGSAFTRFVRDGYTTLPERGDRPLFVGLDVHWRYADAADLLAPEPRRYVASEQVRDLVGAVFDGFVSESIQHLVHEMGVRLLGRFPQLAEVSFAARNLTPDPAGAGEDGRARVYTAPFPAYGLIELTVRREG